LTTERMLQIQPGKDIEGAPDLAIEVLSPSDKAARCAGKSQTYFTAGSKAVWLVHPQTAKSKRGNRKPVRRAFLGRSGCD